MDNTIAKIDKWAKTFDLPIKHKTDDIPQERRKLSMRLIKEEYKELLDAFEDNSPVDIADALGDLIWVSIRKCRECGIPIKAVIDKIYKANMSKLDTSEEDARKSVETYREKGVEASYRRIDGNKFQIYRVEDNKVLKANCFKAPEEDLAKLLNPDSVVLKYKPIDNDLEYITVENSDELVKAFQTISRNINRYYGTVCIQHKEMNRFKSLMKDANIIAKDGIYKVKGSPFSIKINEVSETYF